MALNEELREKIGILPLGTSCLADAWLTSRTSSCLTDPSSWTRSPRSV